MKTFAFKRAEEASKHIVMNVHMACDLWSVDRVVVFASKQEKQVNYTIICVDVRAIDNVCFCNIFIVY